MLDLIWSRYHHSVYENYVKCKCYEATKSCRRQRLWYTFEPFWLTMGIIVDLIEPAGLWTIRQIFGRMLQLKKKKIF